MKLTWVSALLAALLALVVDHGPALAAEPAQPTGAAPEMPELPEQPLGTDASPQVYAGEDTRQGPDREKPQLSDLTLFNFFSAGWDEDSVKRERATGTPDLALLRVQTNFMEREIRVNYFFQNNIRSKTRENLDNLDGFIAYAFNRRFMLEVFGNYQWVDGRKDIFDVSGGSPQLVGRVQLVDTESSSYTFNFRAAAPNRGIGEHQTTLSYGFAAFEDLAYWLGEDIDDWPYLDRVGLYYSVLFDSLAGPHEAGTKQNDVAYDITLAKTLTRPDTPLLGTFTVFLEAFAQTDLDGDHSGRTLVTLTPGIRFNLGRCERIHLGKDNWLLYGVDIPVAGPKPYDAIYRFTYIKNF